MPYPIQLLDPALSVNAVLLQWPAAVSALNALGIDTCCGGAASLREAAADAGVPLGDLLAAIAHAVDVPTTVSGGAS